MNIYQYLSAFLHDVSVSTCALAKVSHVSHYSRFFLIVFCNPHHGYGAWAIQRLYGVEAHG